MTDTNLLPNYNLPSEVIDAILVSLPIKDAVRTSILSRNWRFQWHAMSKLKFDMRCLPPSMNQAGGLNKLVKIVDCVLTLHVGPIRRFELLIDLPSYSDVDRWIIFLSRNHIKEIVLKFSNGEPYSVPSTLFSCEALTHLELCHCMFKLPISFKKLSKLTTLVLDRVSDPGGTLEALISNCPLLRKLHLTKIEVSGHLKIHAPNLAEVCICDIYCDVGFDNAPCLVKATFALRRACNVQHLDHVGRIKIAQVIRWLPNIEELRFEAYAIQCFLSDGCASDELPDVYNHLNSLYMEIDFGATEEFMAALCLLRSSPNLEVLDVPVYSSAAGATTAAVSDSWEPKNLDLTFSQLRVVKMTGITGRQQEMHLIKCILANAPLLRTIKISINHKTRVVDDSKIFVELLRYRRASALAEIIYTG